ncbi:MAG: septal ring lytic transglycosylase RlpA family protein [Pseudomonadales bacterium]|nr:septal ring lytic transglycosylase RlpA family protein [Pseudomonadales bacterium]
MRRALIGICAVALLAGCVSTRNESTDNRNRGSALPAPPPDIAAIPDAVPRAEPRSRYGNPPFYEVFGRRYQVMSTADGYAERGLASWYGPGFHAENTSNGERYDMYAMTAAHKTLPLPAYVQVTNLDNGRSVVVRVNDRGPFVDGRIIDLSYTAAAKLDMIRAGTARVEVRVLTPSGAGSSLPERPLAAPVATANPLYIQVGAFSSLDNARALLQRLFADGIDLASIRSDQGGAQPLHRVRIGPLGSVEEFDRMMARLAELGVAGGRLAGE